MIPAPLQNPTLRSQTIGGAAWTFRSAADTEELHAVLESPDSFLLEAALHFKHSRNVTVARIPRAGQTGWVLRRLNYGKALHQLRDLLRPTRAHRAFNNGLRLEQAGVSTARVIAAGEVRRLGWPMRAYLLTEEIPGAVTLQQLLQTRRSTDQQPLASLAETLARLHNAGFSHRDLKAANVLFDDRLRAHLIDLDGVRRMRGAARSQAEADLARLAKGMFGAPSFSREQWNGFIQAYCHDRGDEGWQRWSDAVSAGVIQQGATGVSMG